MTTYTTKGSVRGECGHQHRCLETAYDCAIQDQRRCAGPSDSLTRTYSDRTVVRGDGSPLSGDEREELWRIRLRYSD